MIVFEKLSSGNKEKVIANKRKKYKMIFGRHMKRSPILLNVATTAENHV